MVHCTVRLELLCFTDLYACKSNPLTTNSSIILDEITSVGASIKGGFQRRIVLNTTLCPSHSSSNQYLEIKLRYFYDVCAVSSWTDISRLKDTNFKIKVSYNGRHWDYYREIGKVKVSFCCNVYSSFLLVKMHAFRIDDKQQGLHWHLYSQLGTKLSPPLPQPPSNFKNYL